MRENYILRIFVLFLIIVITFIIFSGCDRDVNVHVPAVTDIDLVYHNASLKLGDKCDIYETQECGPSLYCFQVVSRTQDYGVCIHKNISIDEYKKYILIDDDYFES